MKDKDKRFRDSYSQLKLYVENVNLTVKYYREYAGFDLIERYPKFNFMHSAKLYFQDNFLILEKANNINHINNQEIVFQLYLNNSELKGLYDNYKRKIRINHVSFDDTDHIKVFSIKDCDGNIINFQNNQFENNIFINK